MSEKPFPVPTGSRFSATTIFCYHLYQSWTYAVWISKIRLLVLMLWAKSLFPSQPEVDFQRRQFFVITSIDPKHMPFEFWESVHKYSGYEPKTCFWRSFSIFLAKPEVDFKNERWWTLFPDEPEFMPFKIWKSVHKYPGYEPKTCFWRSFSIFLAKPEVDSKNERQRTLFCIKLELLAFEFWKSVH